MRNRYPGICYRCLKVVEAGEGHFQKRLVKPTFSNGWTKWTWAVQHAGCAIVARRPVDDSSR